LEHPHTLIFFTSHLLRNEYPGQNIAEEELLGDYPIDVPWTAWGFQTRMILSTFPRNAWSIRAHGTRLILQIKGDVPNHYKIRVLDFNPYIHSVPEELLNAQSSTTSRYVSPRQDDVLSNSMIFKETIYTTLPYLEVTTKKFFMANAVMIDHDHIYLVEVSLLYSRSTSNRLYRHGKGAKSKCWHFNKIKSVEGNVGSVICFFTIKWTTCRSLFV
jgi:hypothetical protein